MQTAEINRNRAKAAMLTAALFLGWALAGCTALQQTTPTQRWLIACNTYSGILKTGSVANLSPAMQANVKTWRAVIDPICEAPAAPTDMNLLTTLENGLNTLEAALVAKGG